MEGQQITVSNEQAIRLALSAYIGERCTVCGHEFNSVEDIKERDPRCSGKDEHGILLACRRCFDGI